ncbi:hypothetical protein GOQ29_04965 [Clostridium sp. D2Q-14]|uniref:hypothetical protein n=1 Tax=Anaeromonas gelatinilytica TaxID=2683194 RepID=UPI00193B13B0|nr:hypothetical protein [Anaeromonas gelatinilytica]MBS4534967.1 hypothetical protein [Anaeromonas gelatinilytica]
MTLQEMLDDARRRELEMQTEYDRTTKEYELKVLSNDEIRRNMKKEEEELKKQIPQESFVTGSEWNKIVEEIRVLERLLGSGD